MHPSVSAAALGNEGPRRALEVLDCAAGTVVQPQADDAIRLTGQCLLAATPTSETPLFFCMWRDPHAVIKLEHSRRMRARARGRAPVEASARAREAPGGADGAAPESPRGSRCGATPTKRSTALLEAPRRCRFGDRNPRDSGSRDAAATASPQRKSGLCSVITLSLICPPPIAEKPFKYRCFSAS